MIGAAVGAMTTPPAPVTGNACIGGWLYRGMKIVEVGRTLKRVSRLDQ